MKGEHPYENCPVCSSDRFTLRLVEQGDAEDLLACYSDPSAVRVMNADNCTSDFHYTTLDQMNDCIRGWLSGYERGGPIRFSVIDKQVGEAVGTIEMYAKTAKAGILRIDLRSAYETRGHIGELLRLSVEPFYESLGVSQIMVKAIPEATERILALRACAFTPVEHNTIMGYGDYYAR